MSDQEKEMARLWLDIIEMSAKNALDAVQTLKKLLADELDKPEEGE